LDKNNQLFVQSLSVYAHFPTLILILCNTKNNR